MSRGQTWLIGWAISAQSRDLRRRVAVFLQATAALIAVGRLQMVLAAALLAVGGRSATTGRLQRDSGPLAADDLEIANDEAVIEGDRGRRLAASSPTLPDEFDANLGVISATSSLCADRPVRPAFSACLPASTSGEYNSSREHGASPAAGGDGGGQATARASRGRLSENSCRCRSSWWPGQS